ncbi:MAG: hypothetical protein ABI779_08780 [Acidobacteriota bacterium]
MKTSSATLLLLVLLTTPVLAQEDSSRPDYSRDSLQRFVMSIPPKPERDRNMRFYVGGVEFSALGTKWNLFNPMLPFSGTRPTTNRELPDPFSLTRTAIATPMRAWRTQRQLDAELKRIEKSERARVTVTVKAQ